MLTKNERKWLKEREEQRRKFPWNNCYRAYTSACKLCRDNCKYILFSCPLCTNWKDAAEFEARVAVVAANGAQPCLTDGNPDSLGGECPEGKEKECCSFSPCATRCGLKYARLYVEEQE